MKSFIIIWLLILFCNAKGIARGGGRGISNRGSSVSINRYSKSKPTNYRNTAVIGSFSIWIWTKSQHTYKNSNINMYDKSFNDADDLFICGNSKQINYYKLCDNIDDCGDGTDEISPAPCNGIANSNELNLYIGYFIFTILWIFVYICIYIFAQKFNIKDFQFTSIVIGVVPEATLEHFFNKDLKLKLKKATIIPIILGLISISFYLYALFNKTLIIHFYILNLILFSIFIFYSCCNEQFLNTIILIMLLIACSVSYTHYSNYFDTFPVNLLEFVDYKILSTNNINNTHIIENIKSSNLSLYWEYTFDKSSNITSCEFIISLEREREIAFINIYPNIHNKTTDNFAIYTKDNNSNWFNIVRGPIPYYKAETYIAIPLEAEDIYGQSLYYKSSNIKFKLFSTENCTYSCKCGLNEVQIGCLKI